MRLLISIAIQDDSGNTAQTLAPVQALFDSRITQETVEHAQKLMAEALERHTRKNKTFDGMAHWNAPATNLGNVT